MVVGTPPARDLLLCAKHLLVEAIQFTYVLLFVRSSPTSALIYSHDFIAELAG
jgi:hypothetical protein